MMKGHRRGRYTTLMFLMTVSLASCRGGADGDNGNRITLHPTDDNIPVITDPRFILHEQKSDTEPWVDFSALQGHKIGVGEGALQEMIGQVRDLTIGPGVLYYADTEHYEVRAYDLRGSLKAIVGTRGQGPGEFYHPTGVAVTADGALLVVGDGGRRIQVFRQQDSAYALESTFLPVSSFSSGDICVMHGHIYTTGYSEELDAVIHKYTFDGEHVASFGAPYKATSSFVRGRIARMGAMECNETNRVIGYVHPKIPVLTGYSETGAVVWRVKFADAKIAPMAQSRKPNGATSVTYRLPDNGEARRIYTVESAWSDAFIVSYLTRGENNTARTWHLFRVDAASGQGAYMGWYAASLKDVRQPMVVAMDSEHLYTSTNEPYPQIGIYRLSDIFP